MNLPADPKKNNVLNFKRIVEIPHSHVANAKTVQTPRKMAIALQGGGSYGAYTKGVLTTLFESEMFRSGRVELSSIAGTSAGAMNGALCVSGLNAGGYDLAISQMNKFWKDVGRFSFYKTSAYPNLHPMEEFAGSFLSHSILPTLKSTLKSNVKDWDAIRNGPVKLFTNAVEVMPDKSHRHIVFDPSESNVDTVVASTALQEFGAHSFDGRSFYDGAYARNPCTDDVLKGDVEELLVVTLQRKPKGPIRAKHQDEFQRASGAEPGKRMVTAEVHHHIAHIRDAFPHIRVHTIGLDVDPRWDDTSRMNNDSRWLAQLSAMGEADAKEWLAIEEPQYQYRRLEV